MKPSEITTLGTSVNGDSTIDATLFASLINIGKAILEAERDWMRLRKTNTSLSVTRTSASAWNTPISLSTITDFSRFFGDTPVRIFDGGTQIEMYHQVPFERRLEYKDANNTFCYDVASKNLYLNGLINVSGTLHIDHIIETPEIDFSIDTDVESVGSFPFPKRFHPILVFYAVGMNKGAIDYDSINREMLPQNQSILFALKTAMTKWDNEMQLSAQASTDPSGGDSGNFHTNRINVNG